ncbi:MAG: hypothetical protein M3680_00705 [Myxococcota bacterium]|nr:hypothetical protein [Myxococcota bacterium]
MLSSTVRAVAMYGALALALAGLVVVWTKRRGRAVSHRPGAAAIGRPAWRATLSRWAPITIIPVGLGVAYWVKGHSIEVMLVSDGAAGPRVERKLARSIDAPVAEGAWSELPNPLLDPLWVVNRSTRGVRVETLQYGGQVALANPPVLLPPGTSGAFYRIEYVGPRDQPADRVLGSRLIGSASRYWLTWDP